MRFDKRLVLTCTLALSVGLSACIQPGMWVGRTGVTLNDYATPMKDTAHLLGLVQDCLIERFGEDKALDIMNFRLIVYPESGSIRTMRHNSDIGDYAGLYEPVSIGGFLKRPGIHIVGKDTLRHTAFLHEMAHHVCHEENGNPEGNHGDRFQVMENYLKVCVEAR